MAGIHFFVYLLLFLSLLILFFYTISSFVKPILWAIVFGIVIYPLHDILRKKLKKDTLSSLLLTVLVFFVVLIPLTIIAFITTQQIFLFSIKVINFIQSHSINDYLNIIKEHPYVKNNKETLEPLINYIQSEEFRRAILNTVNAVITFIGDKLRNYVYTAGTSVFNAFVFLLTLFFILKDGNKILHEVIKLIPMKEEDLEVILKTIYKTVLAVIYGTVGTAIAQAIMSFIGYSLAGVNFALIWSLLTFFAAFIPPFGAAFIWVPLDIYLFTTKGIKEGIILLVFGTFFISTMDNIVRPLVMKQGIKLPYIALFFATIGGLVKFGFIGIFLGPIILTTLLVSTKIYKRRILGD